MHPKPILGYFLKNSARTLLFPVSSMYLCDVYALRPNEQFGDLRDLKLSFQVFHIVR